MDILLNKLKKLPMNYNQQNEIYQKSKRNIHFLSRDTIGQR
ncbi:hypothetical protein HMPREF9071_1781 [Capnocytophaga sp. oral taxon 338 str. F0234]|nr:hypothetical protein HMPREF9071_1781 [Capnocytophaga sp. oral taxon 338 str. F0234]